MFTVGSLFSGIGGLDLGLERAGMSIRWHSEIDPYACKILKKHWPEVPNHGDIKQIDWRTVEPVDVICGGYPCQPFSIAGSRRGEDDSRHLWPMFADCIRVVRPRYALLENVSVHLGLGFGTVHADLAEIGYDARWDCIPAAALGAPHLRDRVFVIARDKRTERRRPMADSNNRRSLDPLRTRWDAPWDGRSNVANAKSGARRRTQPYDLRTVYGQATKLGKLFGSSGSNADWWKTEPDVGRVANGVPSRVDRLRGLGNAVVPQVAEYIGRLVMAAELDNA